MTKCTNDKTQIVRMEQKSPTTICFDKKPTLNIKTYELKVNEWRKHTMIILI